MLISERAPATTPTAHANRERTEARRRRRDLLAVAAMTVVAVALRLPTIGRSYWVDEAISVGIASRPLGQLPQLLRHDGSPPLWYVLLHGWMAVFGTAPVATHALALLVSVLVVPVAWWAGRQVFGAAAGLAAAGLAATNPFLAWYGTENRMYTLMVGLALVALTLTIRARRDRSARDAVGAAVTFAALVYTHNWGLYLLAATGATLLVLARRDRDRGLAVWTVAAGAGVGIAYLPWLPSLIEQASATAAPWAVPPGIGDLFADPTTTLGGTIGFLVAPALLGGVVLTRRSRSRATSDTATFLVVVTVVATLGGWLLAHLEPSWTVRYLAVTIPGWLLAAAGTLSATRTGRRVLAGVCTALAAWSVVGSLWPNPDPANAKDNGAAVAAAASGSLRAGDLVVVTQTEQTPVISYYLPAGLSYYDPMGRVADPGVVDWDHIITRLGAASPCASVEPAVAALPVGARVLEVDPLSPVGASGSAWSKDAHRQVVAIDDLLGQEPSLRPVRSFTQGTSPKPFSPVIGELFVKVRGATTCP